MKVTNETYGVFKHREELSKPNLDELICNANNSLNYKSHLLKLLYKDVCTVT